MQDPIKIFEVELNEMKKSKIDIIINKHSNKLKNIINESLQSLYNLLNELKK